MKDSGKPTAHTPKIISRAAHSVSREEISESALKVLYRLNKAGYQAFLVGGCVRDALLGLHPKDFDVATDATPDEVRDLFSNCRLIGRRFRLAHVRFGREVIEVATFRAAAVHEHDDVAHDHEGRILRDNVYGTLEEDVWRRDFTCNALYYNIDDFSIWDYVDGVRDVDQRRLVLIGDADKRVREDPVRMLRAVRFAAKLDFTIEESAGRAIRSNVALLTNVPSARLFDEFLKLFGGGRAETDLRPAVRVRLVRTDVSRHRAGTRDRRGFPPLRARCPAQYRPPCRRRQDGDADVPPGRAPVGAGLPGRRLASRAGRDIGRAIAEHCGLGSRRRTAEANLDTQAIHVPMREMMALQPRFYATRGRRAMNLLEHRRFRAAYDFMMLLSDIGRVDPEIAAFWSEVQSLSSDQRMERFQVPAKARKQRRRRQRNPSRDDE